MQTIIVGTAIISTGFYMFWNHLNKQHQKKEEKGLLPTCESFCINVFIFVFFWNSIDVTTLWVLMGYVAGEGRVKQGYVEDARKRGR